MKYKTFATNYPKKKFEVEESIAVEEHDDFIDIKKQYKYSHCSGYQSVDMMIGTAKKLRDLLNKIFPIEIQHKKVVIDGIPLFIYKI